MDLGGEKGQRVWKGCELGEGKGGRRERRRILTGEGGGGLGNEGFRKGNEEEGEGFWSGEWSEGRLNLRLIVVVEERRC